jgi:hypothetical protein
MKCLYIAWQDPQTRTWYTVGRLTRENDVYRFEYTRGALSSPRFSYLGRMRDLRKRYVSESLFPLFANRLLNKSRPEYPEYIRWLGVASDESDPMQILARSGGKRATDQICLYPHPDRSNGGDVELFFFSHGLRYLDESALQRVSQMKTGDSLKLKRDDDNAHDRFALLMETKDPVTVVGYCPRYLNQDLRRLLDITSVRLSVERVNPDAPIQFRLLCKAVSKPPLNFDLFATEAYQPLSDEIAA